MADLLIKAAVKGVAGGIGLASESISAHKAKKHALEAQKAGEHSNAETRSPQDSPLTTDEEEHWALDDAQFDIAEHEAEVEAKDPKGAMREDSKEESREITREDSKEINPKDPHSIVEAFLHHYPPPENGQSHARLPYPVILPQRRPKDRSRGFIRAYAPVLMNCGIEQGMFLDFIEQFDRASQASPWLNAINLAGLAFSWLPSGISMAIGIAIGIAVKVSMEMQSRHRTNTFLDRVNNEFFRPRGLYCLVMTWNPDSAQTQTSVNLSSSILESINPGTGIHKLSHNLQSANGKTYGEMMFPETAPLVFPVLDVLDDSTHEDSIKTKDKLKKKAEFVGSYWDKRAQARYAAKHPDSMLVQGPVPEFHSRYADPNHPASSGNLWSLVTGGHFNPPTLREIRGGMGGQTARGFGYGGGYGGYGGYGGLGRMGGGFGRLDGIIAARAEMMGGGLGRFGGYGRGYGRYGGGYGGGYGGEYGGEYGGRYGYGPGYDPRFNPGYDPRYGSGPGYDQGGYSRDINEDSRDNERGLKSYSAQYTESINSQATHRTGGGVVSSGGIEAAGGGMGLAAHGVKKLLSKNVLYLMIVNMPSDEELAMATEQLSKVEQGYPTA